MFAQADTYLEDREIKLDSPIDTPITQVQAFGAAMEREKARQRVSDAMVRKARQGFVTGGRCYGYDNVIVTDAAGRKSHTARTINAAEAAVVREMFERCANGEVPNASRRR